jgi:hypothetical protein
MRYGKNFRRPDWIGLDGMRCVVEWKFNVQRRYCNCNCGKSVTNSYSIVAFVCMLS